MKRIVCPDRATNWQVLNHVVTLGNLMALFSPDAKLRIYATPEMVEPFEIRVDELPIYRETKNILHLGLGTVGQTQTSGWNIVLESDILVS